MAQRKVLQKQFFARSSLLVAPDLVGKFLVRRIRGKEISCMVIEVEAYVGVKDKASHAHRGRTPRNDVMFGEAGIWYVYLIYGMYEMLNVVTGAKGSPSAVLIRGVEGIAGPGRLTRALRIDRKLNKKKTAPASGLWFEDRGVVVQKKDIQKTPRIGVAYAAEWADKPYRFVLNR